MYHVNGLLGVDMGLRKDRAKEFLYNKDEPIQEGPLAPLRVNPSQDGKGIIEVKRECKNSFHPGYKKFDKKKHTVEIIDEMNKRKLLLKHKPNRYFHDSVMIVGPQKDTSDRELFVRNGFRNHNF